MFKIDKIVDLSWPIDNNSPIYPGDPIPSIQPFCTIKDIGYNLFSVHIGTQTGTHVDAPFHLRHGTKTIDQMPLKQFIGEAFVVDVSTKNDLEEITVNELVAFEKDFRRVKIVMFKTNWYKYVRTNKYLKHPYLNLEACKYLIKLGINLICIDTLNLDKTFEAKRFPVHEYCADNNVMVCENMAYFDKIDFPKPILVAIPMNIIGGDGSPVRAFVMKVAN